MAATAFRADDLGEHYAWLRKLALRLVRDSDVAEDLIQDTLAAALENPPDRDRPIEPWLGGVLRNKAFKWMRARGRRTDREQVAGERDRSLPSADELAESAESARVLMDELRGLEPALRDVLLLFYMQGMAAAEIARRTGQPAGTVRWRLKEGRDRLRARLDRRFGGDGRAWCLAMATLVRRTVPATTAAGGAGLSGLGLAWIALLVAGIPLLVWRLASPPAEPELTGVAAPVATNAAPGPAAPGDERDGAGARRGPPTERSALALEEPVAAPSAASAPRAIEPGQAAVRLAVRSADGEPLRGARVTWLEGRDAWWSTSPSGEVWIRLRPPADFARLVFLVEASGHARRLVHVDVATDRWTDAGTVQLTVARRIAGRVVDESGAPLADALVLAATEPWDPALARSGPTRRRPRFPVEIIRTDGDGRFAFDRVPSAAGAVWAAREDTLFAATAFPAEGDRSDLEVRVAPLPAGERIEVSVLGLDGEVQAGAHVRCVPTFGEGEPVAPHPMAPHRRWGRAATRLETDAEGRAVLQPRYAVPHRIVVEDPLDRWADVVLDGVPPGATEVVRFEREL